MPWTRAAPLQGAGLVALEILRWGADTPARPSQGRRPSAVGSRTVASHTTDMTDFVVALLIITGPCLGRLLGLPVPELVDAVSTLATYGGGLRWVAWTLTPFAIRAHLVTLEWLYVGRHRR